MMDTAAIEKYFEENFTERGELGAGVSIWRDGGEILNLSGGYRDREKTLEWGADTLAPVYSATKGPAAATLLHVLSLRGMDGDSLVSEVWSGFPLDGATFSQMLSHQCGLAALDEVADVFDHAAVISAVENTTPEWVPGEAHGYHPRTIGFLMDECVRRMAGRSLGEVWNEDLARPLGIDLWIGLPESEWGRVAKLVPGRAKPSALEQGFYAAFNSPESVTRRAFSSPRGLHAIAEMNDPKAWSAALPAMGGVGSARGLAKFYQAAIGAMESPFSTTVKEELAGLQVSGEDQVLLRETAFTSGCQKDPVDADGRKKRELYGKSTRAFGHPGAGGSHGFGDPESGLSFAYVMNQMELSVMPGERCTGLVERIGCALES
ncbi:serine hydrolase domain-containing protein [Luteolibacter sp. AS25]|uniref:serine hydrolase domain-containing protein n=1 Tax=Luteolibacter sp. AS25 TaxID=3135776 RepID=UPI00398A543F